MGHMHERAITTDKLMATSTKPDQGNQKHSIQGAMPKIKDRMLIAIINQQMAPADAPPENAPAGLESGRREPPSSSPQLPGSSAPSGPP